MYVGARLEYALRALTALPLPGDVPLKATCLAEAHGLSVVMLRAVLTDLRLGGLVAQERGPHGGYSLAKSPEEISVSDVVVTLRILPVETHPTHRKMDDLDRRLAALWKQVENATIAVLTSITIADIARGANNPVTLVHSPANAKIS